jgi:RNase P/RNase MRP subunit p29
VCSSDLVKHKFQVTKITNKALYGDTERVVYEEIETLEVEGKKSGGLKEAWNRIF